MLPPRWVCLVIDIGGRNGLSFMTKKTLTYASIPWEVVHQNSLSNNVGQT